MRAERRAGARTRGEGWREEKERKGKEKFVADGWFRKQAAAEPVAGKGALAPTYHRDTGSQNWTFKQWERSPPGTRPGSEVQRPGR